MVHKKHFVFVNNDIDGATAFLVFKWLTGKKDLLFKTVSKKSLKPVFDKWISTQSIDEYDFIYFFDIDPNDISSQIPPEKIVVINNTAVGTTPGTKIFVDTDTSTCKLVYRLFHKKLKTDLTDQQKLLLILADDLTRYAFAAKGSYELGLIFSNYQGDRVQKYINNFHNGFTGFTPQHNNIINFYRNKLDTVKRDTEIFSATLPLQGENRNIVAAFADSFINEISDWLISTTSADISIIYNMNDNRVSFRRSELCNVNLSVVAKKLAGGGGHVYSSGGFVTDKMLQLSKILKPYK